MKVVKDIRSRLEATTDGHFKLIGGSFDFATINRQTPSPAVFVVPESDRGGKNTRMNGVSQKFNETFSVVLCISAPNDKTGIKSEEALIEARQKIIDALLGWVPGSEYEEIVFVRGDLVSVRDGRVWWQDSFSTETTLTK